MTRKKQISIKTLAQIDILNKEEYSKRCIAKKVITSSYGVQYFIERRKWARVGIETIRKRAKLLFKVKISILY